MSEPTRDAGDRDGGVEVLFEFVEARGESSELFEMGEGPFDAISLAIEGSVEAALHFAHRTRWDDGSDAAVAEVIEDRIGVVSFVGQYGLGAAVAEQSDGLGAVMGLATGQHEAERQAKLIGEQVDLGRQTSSTPPQSGLRSPFFRAVAAC